MFDVITSGSATLDVYADTDAEEIRIRTKDSAQELLAYPLGSKILIKNLDFKVGGGGTNTAVSFSKLGLKTGFLGVIGRDENGLKIFKALKENKVEFLGSLGDVSGYSVILDSFMDDRTILTYKGCNNHLKFSSIDLDELETKWFYFASMRGESHKTIQKLAEYAKRNQIKLAYNPSNYQASQGLGYVGGVLKNADVLILNKQEAELLVGKGKPQELLKRLTKHGPAIVVITDGKNGVFALHEGVMYVVPPKKVKVVEKTGAGDAFGAGFVAGLVMNKSMDFCLRLGMNNAESCIQERGAKNGLLTKQQALNLVRRDKRRIVKKNI
jgi:ribokinase